MEIFALTTQEILVRLSRHCPRAIPTYLQCINRADESGKVFFSKDTVNVDMSESWTKFKNDVKTLSHERLLEWQPFNDGIAITLIGHEEGYD